MCVRYTHTHSVTHTHTLFTNGDYALVPSLSHARTATTLSVAIPYPSQSWCRARGICGDIDIRRTMLNNVEQEVSVVVEQLDHKGVVHRRDLPPLLVREFAARGHQLENLL